MKNIGFAGFGIGNVCRKLIKKVNISNAIAKSDKHGHKAQDGPIARTGIV